MKLANGVSAKFHGPGIPVALTAGDALNVVRANNTTDWGRETATLARTAAADTVEKTGSGSVRIAALPSDVKKLDVKGGRVVLAVPQADTIPELGDNNIHATIPNHSFESSDMSGWVMSGGGSNSGRYK